MFTITAWLALARTPRAIPMLDPTAVGDWPEAREPLPLYATQPNISRSSAKYSVESARVRCLFRKKSSSRHLPEPAPDRPHQGAEFLDAEQPGAERVQQQRAAAPDHRDHEAVQRALVHERPDDGDDHEDEHQTRQRGEHH